jgi:hypothetical protein
MTQVMGLIVAIALVVAALWSWGQAEWIAENARRPDLAIWAARSAAISAAAGAQVLVLTFVVGALFRRRMADEVAVLVSGAVCTIALVGAIALSLVSR